MRHPEPPPHSPRSGAPTPPLVGAAPLCPLGIYALRVLAAISARRDQRLPRANSILPNPAQITP